ncbi:uncharacterized protein [Atheta coriaria]|uniref:uncharacterized protein n=1 Tax=Dalotia coriaria TaxID=877792 RepID=UPI0031F3A7C0
MTDYDFTTIVREVGIKENIPDCTLDLKYSTNKGDGYLGTVQAVQLVGKGKKLDVVFKFSHRNPKSHESLPLRDVYLNEVKFYEEIIPAFTKLQLENHIEDGFDNVPKFYGSIKEPLNELLVLENLKVSDYDLWDRKKLMNKEHLEFALKTFAKFHGTSYAMQKINPKMYEKITESMKDDVFLRFVIKMGFTAQIQGGIKKIVNIFDSVKEKKYIDALTKFGETLPKEMEAILTFHEADVILQGDCWCNNGMYHYDSKDHTKPNDMKMLDFQLMRLGSPALDLSYFFYTISPKESYENLEYFLKVYHDALGKHLAKFNLKVEEIYPYKTFKQHWEKLSKFGLVLSFLIRKAMLTESEDAPDITEGDFLANMYVNPEKERLYHQQMKDLIIHFVDSKFV